MKFRNEWKHIINYSDMVTLRARLRAVAKPEIHGIGGKYDIRSIYFDDLFDTALLEKKNSGAMLLSDTAETGNNQNSGMPSGMPGGMDSFDPSNIPGGMGSFDPSNIPGGMGNFDPENMPGGMGDFDPENIPGGMQIPGWSQEGSSFPSSNSGTGNTNRAPAASNETTLLVTSVLFLLGGLAFAYFFKRRK